MDRAASTTVSALRIAVTIAAALSNQKLVFEQVNALRATTEDIIRTNAEMLAAQSGEIQRIAAEPSVGLETLRTSFEQIYRTIDAIDTYKVAGGHNMQATVDALGTRAEPRRRLSDARPRAERASRS